MKQKVSGTVFAQFDRIGSPRPLSPPHNSVGIPSRSYTGSGYFGISRRLPLRICRPVQSGNYRASANRRVKQLFTARAKLLLQLLRQVMQLSVTVSDQFFCRG